MGDYCLSHGGAAALVNLSEKFQDVEIIVQVKEKLNFRDQYAVSDGVHWVPVFLGSRVRPVEIWDIIQITRACYYRNPGCVFVGRATVARDPTPVSIIGNPLELALEADTDSRKRFPIARLDLSRWYWSGETEDSSYPPIRALVTYKSGLEGGIVQGGKPPFFMIHLLDETGEIRAHASDGIARELYDHLEEGKVYYIYNTSVTTNSNSSFYNLTNLYRLNLTRETVIEECHETVDIPVLRFDFLQLDQVSQAPETTICDVISVVLYVGPLEGYIRRKNQETFRRVIMIADQTKNNVFALLWANRAAEFDVPTGTVVAFRNVKVTIDDDQVRYLSVLSPSTIHIDPQMEETVALRRWYEQPDSENMRVESPE